MTDEKAQTMEEAQYQRLRQFLAKLPQGQVPSNMQPELVQLLQDCWHMFSGSTEEGMEAYKLERMEDPEWHSPSLAFTIERHGGTAMGSSRAELQAWFVDLDHRVATAEQWGTRQLYPRAPSLDVKPIAEELVHLIMNRTKDDRLKWSAKGHVQVLIGKILPEGSAVKQTLLGRRSRLSYAIAEKLTAHGWRKISHSRYAPPNHAG